MAAPVSAVARLRAGHDLREVGAANRAPASQKLLTRPMDINKEISFFDQFEKEHGDYDVLAEESYERILGALFRGMTVGPDKTCVDLGCGTGAFTRRLSKLELKLTGVDISPGSIERRKGDRRRTGVRRGRYLRLSAAVRLIRFRDDVRRPPSPDDASVESAEPA